MDGFAELIERKRQGSLKVYLGYAAGVGKTYAMLQEGLRLKQQHVDVVIGYLEPHDRPETMALAEHLETVPPREWRVGDAVFHEMDVEAILARKPQVVLVDELAHTNADGSKNDKRYSDVLEVLAQGINVISTINVQHLESVAARVEEATGIAVRERIPDTVLRRADQVVNVDVTKEELRERLRQGKIYAPQQAERALSSFFTYENLSFLRELCLREASGDQVRKIEAQELLKPALAGYAVEAVMVALSSWPTDAESLIRRGVRMANQLGSPCYVVYVRRPQESPTRIDAGIQRQLHDILDLIRRHLHLFRQFLYGSLPAQLLCHDLGYGLKHIHSGCHRFLNLRLAPLSQQGRLNRLTDLHFCKVRPLLASVILCDSHHKSHIGLLDKIGNWKLFSLIFLCNSQRPSQIPFYQTVSCLFICPGSCHQDSLFLFLIQRPD